MVDWTKPIIAVQYHDVMTEPASEKPREAPWLTYHPARVIDDSDAKAGRILPEYEVEWKNNKAWFGNTGTARHGYSQNVHVENDPKQTEVVHWVRVTERNPEPYAWRAIRDTTGDVFVAWWNPDRAAWEDDGGDFRHVTHWAEIKGPCLK